MFLKSLLVGLIGALFLAAMMPGVRAQGSNTAKNVPYSNIFAENPVQAAGAYKISAVQGDVSVGLEPVESVDDQLNYFHTALAPMGFLPVFVVVENHSKSDSLLLNKSGISYGDVGAKSKPPNAETASVQTGVVTTSLIPFIGPFVAGPILKNATQIKQNIVLRELRSGTIAPGQSAHGYLYIPIPRKGERPKLHVEIPIAWSESNGKSKVNFEF